MNRYWVSWWSGNYKDEGCTNPPFQFWLSGQKDRDNDGLTTEQMEQLSLIKDEEEAEEFLNNNAKDDCSLCACLDANSEEEIWQVVAKHFPDYEPRFCEIRDKDYNPSVGGRFGGFENRTSLYE